MTNFVISSKIGKIKQDSRFEDCWESAKITLPLFKNTKCTFTLLDFNPIIDSTFIQETDIALTNFLNLSVSDRDTISDLVYNNCLDFIKSNSSQEDSDIFERLKGLKNPNEIWNFIKPSDIYITRRPGNDQSIYIQVICDNLWDAKNGLQLVYKHGKDLTRVSTNDGYITDEDASGINNNIDAYHPSLS